MTAGGTLADRKVSTGLPNPAAEGVAPDVFVEAADLRSAASIWARSSACSLAVSLDMASTCMVETYN